MIEPNKQSFQADFFRGLGIDNIQRPYFHVVKEQDIINTLFQFIVPKILRNKYV